MIDFTQIGPEWWNAIFGAIGTVITLGSTCVAAYEWWRNRRVRSALAGEEDELWRFRRRREPKGYPAILNDTKTRIITIANNKGGVGKTTMTANLAAFFQRRGYKVLVIDADYQGSVSSMLSAANNLTDVRNTSGKLLQKDATSDTVAAARLALAPLLPKVDLVPAFAEYNRDETRLLAQWLMDRRSDDIRYRLIRTLMAGNCLKANEHDDGYDVILIDAPPRLTTGAVNALCASTHLLVPTALTRTSAESVVPFVQICDRLFRMEANPCLSLAGVIPTLTTPNGSLTQAESATIEQYLRPVISSFSGSGYIFKRNIPRRTSMAQSGTLAYLENDNAQVPITDILDAFGRELCSRIELE